MIGEYDATGAMIEETVYLGDMPVAVLTQSIDTSGSAPVTSTNVYYIYADQLNTPRVITQASDNQIVWRWDAADPFGVQQPDEDPSGLGGFTFNPRFPGQLYDQETNLHYNGYRDYDPQVGRYVESDPIGLKGGINSYSYVLNNPLRYVDPSGLYVFLVMPGICAAGGCEIIAAAATTVATWWASGPATGEPGSTYWPGPRPDGTYGDGRKYGPEGLPEIDYDHGHPGHHGGIGDHIHDWLNGERSGDPRPYSPWPRPEKAQSPKDGWCPSK